MNRPIRPTYTASRATRLLHTILLTLVAVATPLPALAVENGDPALNQSLDDLAIVHGERVMDSGHVDLGPKYDDGAWKFLIHDDVAKDDANATSVWRYPAETVLHVFDESKLTVPDDPAYSFLGAQPGSPVWVVPQTQNPDVVWLGWNTQDPEVITTIDRGMTLSLTGVEGPGELNVYLQSGSFGEPQVLYDSRNAGEQPAWVDINTHTHANWVFTQPGVYLVQLKSSAQLIDGSTVSDTQVLRFAVGTDTAPADAFAASWQGSTPDPETSAPQDTEPQPAGQSNVQPVAQGTDPLVPVLMGLIGLVGAGLIIGFSIVLVRGSQTRRRVLGNRSPAAGTAPSADGTDQ